MKTLFKKIFQKRKQKKIISEIGNAFIYELKTNRSFRRQVKKTNFGKNLENVLKY